MFKEHSCFVVGLRSKDDTKIPFDELMAELFYPACRENIETNNVIIRLAEEFCLVVCTDMEREDKAT